MKWKVAIVGPTDAVQTNTAFDLLYSFPTKQLAEAHAECFRKTGITLVLCDERGNLAQPTGAIADHAVR